MPNPKLTAKCISCKHKWTMSDEDIKTAQGLGSASCPKCGFIAVVEKVEVKL